MNHFKFCAVTKLKNEIQTDTERFNFSITNIMDCRDMNELDLLLEELSKLIRGLDDKLHREWPYIRTFVNAPDLMMKYCPSCGVLLNDVKNIEEEQKNQ